MALNNQDQAQIRQYLLGKLSEAEQEKIEERLMVEDDLFDEFEASKDELVEEYCAGDLDHTEREWFEKHYLASAEGRQRQAFALTMDYYMRRHAADPAPDPMPDPVLPVRPTFFEQFSAFIKAQPWAVATATSLVLVVAVAFIWFRNSQGQVYEATLTSSAFQKRGDEPFPPPTKIQLPPHTGKVKLHLQLLKPTPAGTTYTADLADQVNTTKVTVESSDPNFVTVSIPRKQLTRAWYMLYLTGTTPNGNVQNLLYSFTVE